MDFFWYHFNITILILVQGSFNIGTRFKMHSWFLCYNDPLSGLSQSSSESIIMIPEKVHKTYYKIMFKEYTTIVQKKDLENKPASTGGGIKGKPIMILG